MAYNIQSLIHILEQLLHPEQRQFVLDHETIIQLGTLLEKAVALKENVEKYPPATSKWVEVLEGQITDATYKAEDIIETHLADQVLQQPRHESVRISSLELQEVIGGFDSTIDKLMKIKDEMLNSSFTGGSLMPTPTSSNFVVGLDEDMLQLKDQLTGSQAQLEFISIVGMGGIGKTTLARHLYSDPLIIYHFDLCAWVTISHEYNVKAILECLVGSVIGKKNVKAILERSVSSVTRNDTGLLLQECIHQLGDVLHKSLSGKRYLIVLDDVWTTCVRDEVHKFLPNNNNGSRIVITTRDLNIANANLLNPHHQMKLLNEFLSWKLLCEKVFGDEECPRALENIGKKIASNCRGLPLAIQVIGGLLSQALRNKDYWEQVGNDVSFILAGDDQQFSKILSLSYDHLPHHLRPCFLYLSVSAEDQEISASKLIRLWVAEGFLEPIAEKKNMEEVAEMYLKELVERNILTVRRKTSDNGKVKIFVIHDMLRDLCMRKAYAEKFVYVSNQRLNIPTERTFHEMRRVSLHPHSKSFYCPVRVRETSFFRSYVYTGHTIVRKNVPLFFALRLLRELDVLEAKFDDFPKEILQLVNIRYLAVSVRSDLPSSLSRLWNLQTLIFHGHHCYFYRIAFEILGLPQIRYIKLKGSCIFRTKGYVEDLIFNSLQTLSLVDTAIFNERQTIKRFQNLRKLGIKYEYFEVVDLSSLHKLEALKCVLPCTRDSGIFLSSLTLSSSIKKLTLCGCRLPSMFMATVGSLPSLEVLKLDRCYFLNKDMKQTEDWEPTEGGFLSLQFLRLESLALVSWKANETNFPRLRNLIIRHCTKLEEIPQAIGHIHTLELIELYESPLAVDSAKLILEEQCELGNLGLQVRIHRLKG